MISLIAYIFPTTAESCRREGVENAESKLIDRERPGTPELRTFTRFLFHNCTKTDKLSVLNFSRAFNAPLFGLFLLDCKYLLISSCLATARVVIIIDCADC